MLLAIIGTVIVVGGLIAVFAASARSSREDSGAEMHMDAGTEEWTVNTQLLQYLNMSYEQFKEQVGAEAEFYHGLYFQAPISGEGADAVFQGTYDDEVAGSVLSDEDKSFRIESTLNNIISGITQEMTVAEFMELLDLHAEFAHEMHPGIQEGLTAYYVAYHYVEMSVDSNGDGIFDIQLNIALDESDYITPNAHTWIYESTFFEDSVQDAELINMELQDKNWMILS